MKLIGSKTEKDYMLQLTKSNDFLFSAESTLLLELKKVQPHLTTAYILEWIPEQGENIYTILINDNIIATIEVDKFEGKESVVELSTVSQYESKISKKNRIKLAVALDLAQKEIHKTQ